MELPYVFESKGEKVNFSNHLNLNDNHRIIFSAPFGSGKTTFLKDYFLNASSEFECFHLYPVNYSVASNEDVFELIKFDILFNFLNRGIDFEKIEITKEVSFGFFTQKNPENIILPFIRHIPLIGKQVSEIGKSLLNLYKKFEVEHSKNQVDQEKTVINYLEQISKTKGNLKEEDFYTQLICELSAQLKSKNKDKKSVLVIDDLDRIDPDHIFRILNVFSAHFDQESSENKFDFDKIILVCDINNIRKIYSNRYGQDVDFSGYIDKFYSKKVFEFSLGGEVKNKLSEVFDRVYIKTQNEEYTLAKYRSQKDILCVHYILYSLVESNFLSVRRLLKIFHKTIEFNGQQYVNVKNEYFELYDFRLLIVIKILNGIFEDKNELYSLLDKTVESRVDNPYFKEKDHFVALLIPFLTYEQHRWEITESKTDIIEVDGIKIKWTLSKGNNLPNKRSIFFAPEFEFLKENFSSSSNEFQFLKLFKKTLQIIDEYDLNWYK